MVMSFSGHLDKQEKSAPCDFCGRIAFYNFKVRNYYCHRCNSYNTASGVIACGAFDLEDLSMQKKKRKAKGGCQ